MSAGLPDRVEEVDYVVVGSGAAGSVLARRLGESGAQVLVLEAGHGWIPEAVEDAARWFTLLGSSVDWGYGSVPQPGLGGRQTYEPRGLMPGGSSNLYIMMHVRGHAQDFDAWAEQGAAGWSAADLEPYLRRIEDAEQPGPASGVGGPQRVTRAGLHQPNPLSAVFLDACEELGHRRLEDVNSGPMLGAAWHQLDVVDGRRNGTMAAYLEPALELPGVTLLTGARATRLLVEDGRCTGVRCTRTPAPAPEGPGRQVGAPAEVAQEVEIRVRREVVLAAGAIESPKLLLLSGIGPAQHLAEVGVPLVHDLPGVGENFHNHVLIGVIAETAEPVQPGHQNLSEAVLFAATDPGAGPDDAPDLQLAFVHVPFDIIVGQQHPQAVSILPGVVRPASRGSIRLADPDPTTPPLVDPAYLAEEEDVERLVDSVELARAIFASSAFAPHLTGELLPGPQVQGREALTEFVRSRADSYHHQAGSCRMGAAADGLAVVDPLLQVRGLSGLRVADASVMPTVPSGNCHAAIVAVAEKAADLILAGAS